MTACHRWLRNHGNHQILGQVPFAKAEVWSLTPHHPIALIPHEPMKNAIATQLRSTILAAFFAVFLLTDLVSVAAPAFTQQAYLKASNPGGERDGGAISGDRFGASIAVFGNTMVVGAPAESSSATGIDGNQDDDSSEVSGAVYVFVRDGATWTQQAYLKASNTGSQDSFGTSVAISGDTLVVGAEFESSNASVVNGDQNNNQAIGSGAAYVFVRNGTTWTQQAYLKPSKTVGGDQFGHSVAISGDTILVGVPFEDSNALGIDSLQTLDAGAAYVFVRNGTTWSQQAFLKASNTEGGDFFGLSVSLSGDTAVVGAFGEDSNAKGINGTQSNNSGDSTGAAYVFVRNGNTWTQQAYLKASNTDTSDFFGFAVGVSGETVVVTATGESSKAIGVNGNQNDNSSDGSGAAYIFVRDGTTWTQQAYIKASNTGIGDSFGESVAISGDRVVIGTTFESSNATGPDGNQSNNSAALSGAAYVFVRSGIDWIQESYLKASNTARSDGFGAAVAISGGTVVIAAPAEDSNAAGINGNQNDNSAKNSGAAYAFTMATVDAAEIALEDSQGTNLSDGGSRAFGDVDVGAGASQTFTIKNTGAADLTGLGITIDGADAAQFTITVDPTAPVVGPSGSTSFTLRFAPTSAGAKTAALHLASNDADENPFDLTLTGSGIAPVNQNPVFSGFSRRLSQNQGATLLQSEILAKASDPDGDTVTITSVSALSAAGGAVGLTPTAVTYNPPLNHIGGDSFTVTLSDGHGGSTVGAVFVSVTVDHLEILAGGPVQACFTGESGRNYAIERSANLTDWSTIQTVSGSATGDICFSDQNPLPGNGFYRARLVP